MKLHRPPPDIGLDHLLDRCRLVDGCMEWAYACHAGRPVVVIDKVHWQVRRLVWTLSRESAPRHHPFMTCTGECCIHPDHMEQRRNSAWKAGIPLSLDMRARIAATKRATSLLSDADVLALRSGTATAADVPVCEAWVTKIRSGRGRRDYSNPFSQLVR